MNEFNIPPPPHFPNPFQEMHELQKEVVETLGDLVAEQEATRGVLLALIATHPDARTLAESYLSHMDSVAETVSPRRIGKYRAAAQRWRDLLLELARQQSQP